MAEPLLIIVALECFGSFKIDYSQETACWFLGGRKMRKAWWPHAVCASLSEADWRGMSSETGFPQFSCFLLIAPRCPKGIRFELDTH
jgi:hypothetical protein